MHPPSEKVGCSSSRCGESSDGNCEPSGHAGSTAAESSQGYESRWERTRLWRGGRGGERGSRLFISVALCELISSNQTEDESPLADLMSEEDYKSYVESL